MSSRNSSPPPSRATSGEPRYPTDYPSVPRFSSFLTYLELCQPGCKINSEQLDAVISKAADGLWELPDEHHGLTALEVVEQMRFAISEDDPGCNLDSLFITVEPGDRMTIKKERSRKQKVAKRRSRQSRQSWRRLI